MTTVPVSAAVKHTFQPTDINFYSIVTIVGGTVGGYISFAGGHRLLEGGIRGQKGLKYVMKVPFLVSVLLQSFV